MTRRAAPIWRHALLQVKGMPECPFDMIEPAYARLAFYARCDVSTLVKSSCCACSSPDFRDLVLRNDGAEVHQRLLGLPRAVLP